MLLRRFSLAATMSLAVAATAQAQAVDPALQEMGMFGISSSTGQLSKVDFSDNSYSGVATVRLADGTTLTGIHASAYSPGFFNIYAFWTSSTTGKTKLVYVNPKTGVATVVGDELEGGAITGATSITTDDTPCAVFGVQQEEVSPPATISGMVNINPNNSNNNEFTMVKSDGSTITRDDLHQNAGTDTAGNLFEGQAVSIRFKPKGNGSQNSLIIDGDNVELQNSNTYEFVGEMNIRIFNDHIHSNGKAMGKWWFEVTDGVVVRDHLVLTPNRLVAICHRTATVNEIMRTERGYDSLATSDGVIFFAMSEGNLYVLDSVNETETLLATAGGKQSAMAFAGTSLMAFDSDADRIEPFSAADGSSLGAATGVGLTNLGTMVFFPLADDPSADTISYD